MIQPVVQIRVAIYCVGLKKTSVQHHLEIGTSRHKTNLALLALFHDLLTAASKLKVIENEHCRPSEQAVVRGVLAWSFQSDQDSKPL